MATMFTIFVNVYTDSRNRLYRGKAYIFETQKIGIYTFNVFNYAYVVGTKMYRLNETILLCTININPWLQKDFLHEFQKSNVTNVKLISLKRKKEISIYTLNVFNQYIS